MKPLPVLKRPYAPLVDAPAWVRTRLDGCPKCHQRGNRPLLWAATDDNEEGVICAYRCNKCEHGWWTGWSIHSVGIELAL